MISLKTPQEIASMREGGSRLGKILQQLIREAMPGMSLATIEKRAQELIVQSGGTPSFSTVEGYNWATCLCINEQVVHGIPSQYVLKEGDVLTIDIGMIYKGFHTDTAWTKIITNSQLPIHNEKYKEKEEFLKTGKKALELAIGAARPDNRLGHISEVIEKTITEAGYSIIQSLTGHGVGKKLHEEPLIPGYVVGKVERTPLLTAGMTLAIEIIYAMGRGGIVYTNDDGWTLETRDKSLTAVFEHTIALTSTGTVVLTQG